MRNTNICVKMNFWSQISAATNDKTIILVPTGRGELANRCYNIFNTLSRQILCFEWTFYGQTIYLK